MCQNQRIKIWEQIFPSHFTWQFQEHNILQQHYIQIIIQPNYVNFVIFILKILNRMNQNHTRLFQKDEIIGGKYKIVRMIGKGSFGQVYQGENLTTLKQVAIKIESIYSHNPLIIYETNICLHLHQINSTDSKQPTKSRTLQSIKGLSKVYCNGQQDDFYFLVMELQGPSLGELFNNCGRRFSLKTILMIAHQLIQRIQYIHEHDIIYRDIKAENILMGLGNKSHVLQMVDFGLAKRYRCKNKHIPHRKDKQLTGTARYASIHSHMGEELSRRDDLESICYLLIYFFKGELPWQSINTADKILRYQQIMQQKLSISIEELTQGCPKEFQIMLSYVRNIAFEEDPDYNFLYSLIEGCAMKEDINLHDNLYDWAVRLVTIQKYPYVYDFIENIKAHPFNSSGLLIGVNANQGIERLIYEDAKNLQFQEPKEMSIVIKRESFRRLKTQMQMNSKQKLDLQQQLNTLKKNKRNLKNKLSDSIDGNKIVRLNLIPEQPYQLGDQQQQQQQNGQNINQQQEQLQQSYNQIDSLPSNTSENETKEIDGQARNLNIMSNDVSRCISPKPSMSHKNKLTSSPQLGRILIHLDNSPLSPEPQPSLRPVFNEASPELRIYNRQGIQQLQQQQYEEQKQIERSIAIIDKQIDESVKQIQQYENTFMQEKKINHQVLVSLRNIQDNNQIKIMNSSQNLGSDKDFSMKRQVVRESSHSVQHAISKRYTPNFIQMQSSAMKESNSHISMNISDMIYQNHSNNNVSQENNLSCLQKRDVESRLQDLPDCSANIEVINIMNRHKGNVQQSQNIHSDQERIKSKQVRYINVVNKESVIVNQGYSKIQSQKKLTPYNNNLCYQNKGRSVVIMKGNIEEEEKEPPLYNNNQYERYKHSYDSLEVIQRQNEQFHPQKKMVRHSFNVQSHQNNLDDDQQIRSKRFLSMIQNKGQIEMLGHDFAPNINQKVEQIKPRGQRNIINNQNQIGPLSSFSDNFQRPKDRSNFKQQESSCSSQSLSSKSEKSVKQKVVIQKKKKQSHAYTELKKKEKNISFNYKKIPSQQLINEIQEKEGLMSQPLNKVSHQELYKDFKEKHFSNNGESPERESYAQDLIEYERNREQEQFNELDLNCHSNEEKKSIYYSPKKIIERQKSLSRKSMISGSFQLNDQQNLFPRPIEQRSFQSHNKQIKPMSPLSNVQRQSFQNYRPNQLDLSYNSKKKVEQKSTDLFVKNLQKEEEVDSLSNLRVQRSDYMSSRHSNQFNNNF